MLEYDSENLNSEEIYSSLRGVTEAIQNFSFRSQEDLMEPLRRDGKRDGMVSATSVHVEEPPRHLSAPRHESLLMMMMFSCCPSVRGRRLL